MTCRTFPWGAIEIRETCVLPFTQDVRSDAGEVIGTEQIDAVSLDGHPGIVFTSARVADELRRVPVQARARIEMQSGDWDRMQALFATVNRRQARYLARILSPSGIILREIDRRHVDARFARVLSRWAGKHPREDGQPVVDTVQKDC